MIQIMLWTANWKRNLVLPVPVDVVNKEAVQLLHWTPEMESFEKFSNGPVRPVGIRCQTGEISKRNDLRKRQLFWKRF